jgi:UDP-glucose 4-epimerase
MTKTYAVTGGAGFIGSHVVDSLLADGARAVVLDDLSSGDSARVPPEVWDEPVDIADAAAVDRVIDACRPAAIFHLGAQSSVTVSVADPQRDCAVNVLGTLNILEASKRHEAPVVFTSTGGALYGDSAPIPASKWAAEAYVDTWALSAGIPHTVCRLGNVYGPRQSPHGEAGVVAIIAHKLWTGDAPVLYGFGEPTRDYIHVFDVVAALRKAVGVPGTFNIATGVETTVKDLYSLLAAASGRHVEPDLQPLRPGELARSCLDPARAQQALGWRAEIGIGEGIARTYAALIAEFEGSTGAPGDTISG